MTLFVCNDNINREDKSMIRCVFESLTFVLRRLGYNRSETHYVYVLLRAEMCKLAIKQLDQTQVRESLLGLCSTLFNKHLLGVKNTEEAHPTQLLKQASMASCHVPTSLHRKYKED